MNEINVLDKSIYNRIAAGEVVEKPASIVKELIENSIDAGATIITVEIKNGGIDYIRISDNGKGIAPKDVPTAFLAHATSKIKNLNDLDSIATLGFRGEALPSIASVAKVSMQTRQKGCEVGYKYVVDNGVVIDSGEIGCPQGTTVVVEDVFGHIPARKKFLQKNNVEESAISTLISKIILANYNVSISLTINGKSVYRSSGQGIESAIYCVYGEDYFSNLLKIDSADFGVHVFGYMGKPSYTKHTKNYQTVIINGRFVVSEDISYWIYGCYMDFLMKRQFPTFVLYINLPYDMIDVNVHPNKLEVKFASVGAVKKIITDTVKEQIINSSKVAKEVFLQDDGVEFFLPDEVFEEKDKKQESPFTVSEFIPENKEDFDEEIAPIITRIISKESEFLNKTELKEPSIPFTSMITKEVFNSVADITISGENIENKPQITKNQATLLQNEEQKPIQTSMGILPTLKYCGKIFNTYLIFDDGENSYFIDQHAAHERILYDKLEKDFLEGKVAVQNLLFPYDFTVSKEEGQAITENLAEIEKAGFIIKMNSDSSFSLCAVPARCGEMNIKNFLSTLLFDVVNYNSVKTLNIFKDKLMQNACKHAIKGEMDIKESEIKALVEKMLLNDIVLYCPHGRPIVIKISKNEVEKWFKRIV